MKAAVLMKRTRLDNRWQSHRWEVAGVLPDSEAIAAGAPEAPAAGAPDTIAQGASASDSGDAQWLHRGFELELHRDEAEGYFLNLSSDRPFVFVMWREQDGRGLPRAVSASYNEAARMLDAGENVDGVPMPAEWIATLARFVAEHYRPEAKKKRVRPPSFRGALRDDR